MSLTIWHNPRCSKSRQTLALLKEHGHEPVIRLYLQDCPTRDEIAEVLNLLELEPSQLIRKGEAAFKDLGLSKSSDEAELLSAMATNAVLIERPIVISDNRAAIGRPPENVLGLLASKN
jgi:arsenate reductase